jgi:hypothetical protein
VFFLALSASGFSLFFSWCENRRSTDYRRLWRGARLVRTCLPTRVEHHATRRAGGHAAAVTAATTATCTAVAAPLPR